MTNDLLMRILYPCVPARPLADYLGWNVSKVYNTAWKLGINKRPNLLQQQNKRLVLNAGGSTRFQPGMVPHNKGIQMSAELYAKCAPTMFKDGHKPHNTREAHAISIRYDKSGRPYSYTKVKDSLWVLTHRLVWESIYGPIPKGYVVRFKDGNNLNIHIENLECIPMRENAIRNSIQRFPGELQTVIRLKSKLNKQLKQKQNGKKRNE